MSDRWERNSPVNRPGRGWLTPESEVKVPAQLIPHACLYRRASGNMPEDFWETVTLVNTMSLQSLAEEGWGM